MRVYSGRSSQQSAVGLRASYDRRGLQAVKPSVRRGRGELRASTPPHFRATTATYLQCLSFFPPRRKRKNGCANDTGDAQLTWPTTRLTLSLPGRPPDVGSFTKYLEKLHMGCRPSGRPGKLNIISNIGTPTICFSSLILSLCCGTVRSGLYGRAGLSSGSADRICCCWWICRRCCGVPLDIWGA